MIMDLKERLVEGDMSSYSWFSTEDIYTDLQTKNMHLPQHLEDVIFKNNLHLLKSPVNQVKAVGT